MATGRLEVLAAVDVKPDVHDNAQNPSRAPRREKCYTDLQQACDENPADICTVVVPPAFHESVVDAALAHDMHVISEKPISNTLEAGCGSPPRCGAPARRWA